MDAEQRLNVCVITFRKMGGYIFSIPKCYTRWDLSFCPAINKRKTGPLTDDEVAALGLKFTCAGCGRAEASVVTKHGHERHCAYLRLAQFWDNPHATQEDDCKCCTGPCTCFPVEAVIDMRGPPIFEISISKSVS